MGREKKGLISSGVSPGLTEKNVTHFPSCLFFSFFFFFFSIVIYEKEKKRKEKTEELSVTTQIKKRENSFFPKKERDKLFFLFVCIELKQPLK